MAELARRARGGMRDALSLADQLLALAGEEPTLADVRPSWGATGGQRRDRRAPAAAWRRATRTRRALTGRSARPSRAAEGRAPGRACLDHLRTLPCWWPCCGADSPHVPWDRQCARGGIVARAQSAWAPSASQLWLEELLAARERHAPELPGQASAWCSRWPSWSSAREEETRAPRVKLLAPARAALEERLGARGQPRRWRGRPRREPPRVRRRPPSPPLAAGARAGPRRRPTAALGRHAASPPAPATGSVPESDSSPRSRDEPRSGFSGRSRSAVCPTCCVPAGRGPRSGPARAVTPRSPQTLVFDIVEVRAGGAQARPTPRSRTCCPRFGQADRVHGEGARAVRAAREPAARGTSRIVRDQSRNASRAGRAVAGPGWWASELDAGASATSPERATRPRWTTSRARVADLFGGRIEDAR